MNKFFYILFLLGFLLNLNVAKSEEKDVICYWGVWYHYKGDASFRISDIQESNLPHQCTHLVYADVGIHEVDELYNIFHVECKDPHLDLLNSEDDIDNLCYSNNKTGGLNYIRKMANFTQINPNLKRMAALGGWAAVAPDMTSRFDKMASRLESRTSFIQSIAKFLTGFGLDGFVLDWQKPINKENYILFMKELRDYLGNEVIIFNTMNVLTHDKLDEHWDIPGMNQYFDRLILLGYHMKGFESDQRIAHHSPLFHNSKYPDPELNLHSAVGHLISRDVPRSKIVLGIPLFGKSFEIFDRSQHNFYDDAKGYGQPFPESWSNEGGTLDFFEICGFLPKECPNLVLNFDESYQVPYAYHDTYWVGYDDIRSVVRKAEYVLEENLGGLMIFSIEKDDCPRWGLKYRGLKTQFCDFNVPCPMITAMSEALKGDGFSK